MCRVLVIGVGVEGTRAFEELKGSWHSWRELNWENVVLEGSWGNEGRDLVLVKELALYPRNNGKPLEVLKGE